MDPFIVKLVLSFIVGGLYIAFTIWVSEKFGSKIGGLITGLPSTVLLSLIFIAWSQNPQVAVLAVTVVPSAISACTLFLVSFIFFYRFGRLLAFAIGILTWFSLSSPLVILHTNNIFLSVIIAIIFFTFSTQFLKKFPYRKIGKFQYCHKDFVFRIVFTGSIVAGVVLLTKILGPFWGGLFASFPAAYLSSMYLLSEKYGINFTASVAKTMVYGSMGNVVFAITFFLVVPMIGIISGTIISYLFALIFAIFTYRFVLPKSGVLID